MEGQHGEGGLGMLEKLKSRGGKGKRWMKLFRSAGLRLRRPLEVTQRRAEFIQSMMRKL